MQEMICKKDKATCSCSSCKIRVMGLSVMDSQQAGWASRWFTGWKWLPGGLVQESSDDVAGLVMRVAVLTQRVSVGLRRRRNERRGLRRVRKKECEGVSECVVQ